MKIPAFLPFVEKVGETPGLSCHFAIDFPVRGRD